MFLCILDSILDRKSVDVLDIAFRMHRWATQGGMGIGKTVYSVLTSPGFLRDPHSAAKRVWENSERNAAPNGGIMRTSILGIWEYQSPEKIKDNAEQVCKITHYDPRCVGSCVAVCLAISSLLRGASDIEKLIQEVMAQAVSYDSRIQEYFIKALQEPLEALDLDDGLNKGEENQIGYTLKALGAGFWALKNATSFSNGLFKIIHEGGDADSNGAVAGALLGARFGFSDIPHRLVEELAYGNELRSRTAQFLELLEIGSSRKTSQSVSGINGVFIYAKDPKQLADWYHKVLGIGHGYKDGCYYHDFYQRDYGYSGQVLKMRWAIHPRMQQGAMPTEKPVVSYRIDDINSFIEHLKASGVKIERTEKSDYGLFAYIQDPEGNMIELFQFMPFKCTGVWEYRENGYMGRGYYSRIKELFPEAWEWELYYKKGISFANLGLLDEAIEAYKEAIRINPEYADAHFNLGIVLEDKGHFEEAVKAYREAIRINPEFAKAYNNLGLALYNNGQLDEAIKACKEAIRINPEDVGAYSNLGVALVGKGNIDEAMEIFKKVIRINPEYAEVHNNLGNALADKGRIDEAIKAYKEAIRLNPKSADAHNNLGFILYNKGHFDEAIKEYKEAIKNKPKYVMAYNNLGNALKDRGQIEEAVKAYREAIRINPEHAGAYYNLGLLFYGKGQLDDAIEAYKEAIRLNPKSADAHNNLGLALYNKGQLDEAIKEYKDAIRINPEHTSVYYNLGLLFYNKGQLDDAIEAYKGAIRINPEYAGAYYNLGHVLKAKGRFDEAINAFENFIRFAPHGYAKNVEAVRELIKQLKEKRQNNA